MIIDMITRLFKLSPDLATSKLFNERTFYDAFVKDLSKCRSEAIIESPFMTVKRAEQLIPVLKQLKNRRVKVVINTRPPDEHKDYMRLESERSVAMLLTIGVQVIYSRSHHRKIAVLDRRLLWEGSLNILSQSNSSEIMRRIYSSKHAWEMIRVTGLDTVMN